MPSLRAAATHRQAVLYQEASWNDRLLPNAERDLARADLASALPHLTPTLAALLVPLWLAMDRIWGNEAFWSAVLPFLACFVALGAFRRLVDSEPRKAERFEQLAESLPGRPEYHVRASYSVDGITVGEDEGVLVIEQQWVIFTGFRSHFSVGIDNARRVRADGREYLNGDRAAFATIDLYTEGPERRISLTTVGRQKKIIYADRLDHAIRTWSHDPPPVGTATYPPATPHPSAIRRTKWEFRARLLLLAFILPTWGLLGFIGVGSAGIWALFAALLLTYSLWETGRLAQQLAAYRRAQIC